MRYLTFRDAAGADRVAVEPVVAQGARPMFDVTDGLPLTEFGSGPMVRLIEYLATGGDVGELLDSAPQVERSQSEILAPVPRPSKVVAAPVNYRNHQSEMNEEAHIDALGVFLKAPSSVVGDHAVVNLPYTDRRFDQEGEFAAVIGRRARHVAERDAFDYVFGYTGLLDMTMRGGEDRSVRKSFDTFTPIGPSIVSRDEAGQIEDMELHLRVNGELRQRADLRDLIWGLPRLVSYVSSVMTLEPGDIVTTGTPEGVGQVFDGDVLELDITGLERLRVQVAVENAVVCPTRGANRGPRPPEALTRVSERES